MFRLVFPAGFSSIGGVSPRVRLVQLCWILSLGLLLPVHGEDASLDNLLKKLPPPEKIIKQSKPQQSQRRDPALQDPLFVQVFALANIGNMSEARLYSRKLSEKYPQSEAAFILWGEFAYRLRYYNESASAFQRATVFAPRDAYAWMALAKAENALGHMGTTLHAMAKAGEASPTDGDLAAVIGFSYINLNRVPQAIPPLQRAAKLLPQDFLVQSQLGYCLLTTGQTKAAIGYLQKGATLNSRYGPVWEHLGVAYQKQGRNADAVIALENATRLIPSSPLSWKHLAEAYQATGRTADAQRAAARALRLGAPVPGISRKKA